MPPLRKRNSPGAFIQEYTVFAVPEIPQESISLISTIITKGGGSDMVQSSRFGLSVQCLQMHADNPLISFQGDGD